MIITEKLLNDLMACEEAITWATQKQVIDTEADIVTQALWDDRQSEWYLWAKEAFASAAAIKSGSHEFFGVYRIQEQKFNEATQTQQLLQHEFDTIAQAQQKVAELCDQFNKEFDYLYSVNSLIVLENQDVITIPCDIYSEQPTEPGMAYETFDHITGLYIGFNNYTDALAYAMEKKVERELLTNQQFFVEQQVREINGTATAWASIT